VSEDDGRTEGERHVEGETDIITDIIDEPEDPVTEDEVQLQPETQPQEVKRKKKDLKKKTVADEDKESVAKRKSPKKLRQEAYEPDDEWNGEMDF
jgi:hypothetical protein